MHTKLFVTIAAAIICALVTSYIIIRWMRSREEGVSTLPGSQKREIGFAAVLKDQEEIAAQA
jgi:hypothetical protein